MTLQAGLRLLYFAGLWKSVELYNHAVTGVYPVDDLKSENINIQQSTYVIFETKRCKKSVWNYFDVVNARI